MLGSVQLVELVCVDWDVFCSFDWLLCRWFCSYFKLESFRHAEKRLLDASLRHQPSQTIRKHVHSPPPNLLHHLLPPLHAFHSQPVHSLEILSTALPPQQIRLVPNNSLHVTFYLLFNAVELWRNHMPSAVEDGVFPVGEFYFVGDCYPTDDIFSW